MDILITKQINKENNNQSPSKEVQKLKIQLNDRIFEINKLEEDYAQEKAKYFIDFQKERQYLNRTIKELREKNQFENQEWGKKIQEFREKSAYDINMMNNKCQKRIEEAQVIIRDECLHKFQHQILTLKDQIEQNQRQYIDILSKQRLENEKITTQLKIEHQKNVDKQEKEYHKCNESIKKQCQGKIITLQNLYITEEQQKKQVIKQHQNYIQESVRKQLKSQNQIESMKYKIFTLESQIKKLCKKLQELNEKQIITKNMTDETIKELNIIKMKDIQNAVEEFQRKSNIQKQEFDKEIKAVKEQLKQMGKIYKQKEKKWEQRGQMILKSLQCNQKKGDSLKTIKHLEFQLMKKDNLLQKQRQTVKTCKLQLQNMQEIYDKMFVSNNYLYKFRSKTFKVKKMRVCNQLNQSNNSIFIEDRVYTEGDK